MVRELFLDERFRDFRFTDIAEFSENSRSID